MDIPPSAPYNHQYMEMRSSIVVLVLLAVPAALAAQKKKPPPYRNPHRPKSTYLPWRGVSP